MLPALSVVRAHTYNPLSHVHTITTSPATTPVALAKFVVASHVVLDVSTYEPVLYWFVSVIEITNVSAPIGHARISSVKMRTGLMVSITTVVLVVPDVFHAGSV